MSSGAVTRIGKNGRARVLTRRFERYVMRTAVVLIVFSAMAIPLLADSIFGNDNGKLESSRPRRSFRQRDDERPERFRQGGPDGMRHNRPPHAFRSVVLNVGPGLLKAQNTPNSPYLIKDAAKRKEFETKMKDLLKREREADMKTARLEKDRNIFIANALRGDSSASKSLSANMKEIEAQVKEKSAVIAGLLALLRESFDTSQLSKISSIVRNGGMIGFEPDDRLEGERSVRGSPEGGRNGFRRGRADEERRRRSSFRNSGDGNIERL